MIDIWHEPTETPVEHKTLLFDSIEFDETEMGVYSGGLFHSYNEFEPFTPAGLSRWAYLADFINCQKELERTRKALDVALDALKRANNTYCAEEEDITIDLTESAAHKWQRTAYQMVMPISIALEQITALEQRSEK